MVQSWKEEKKTKPRQTTHATKQFSPLWGGLMTRTERLRFTVTRDGWGTGARVRLCDGVLLEAESAAQSETGKGECCETVAE